MSGTTRQEIREMKMSMPALEKYGIIFYNPRGCRTRYYNSKEERDVRFEKAKEEGRIVATCRGGVY